MIRSLPTRPGFTVTGAGVAALLFALLPASALAADPSNQPGWSSTTQEITTGINLGYELGIDPLNRRLYAADAQGASYSRQFLPDGQGGFTDTYLTTTTQANTGKVVQLDLDTKAVLKNYSYTGLIGSDGTTVGGQYTLPTTHPTTGNGATTGIATASTQLTANNPYGVAVDSGTTNPDTGLPDPTIVSVQTRTSSVAIYKSSQNAPVYATDVLLPATTGLTRARTPVVDSTRHKAYIVGYNATSGVVVQINTLTKQVEATIPVPGADGLAIDTNTGILYAGTYQAPGGNQVNVIDTSKIVVDTANPKNASANAQAVTKTILGVGSDSRPAYDEAGKKLYVANSQSRTVSVIDLDPAHTATYQTVIKTIATTGSPNSMTVDPQRHLAYSADLGSKILSVIDTKTDTWVQGIPTTGNALDVDVDPTTGTAYVSSMTTGTTTGVGQIQAVTVSRPVDPNDLPKGPKGDAGTDGAGGAAGKDGATGAAGVTGAIGAPGVAGPAGTPGTPGTPGATGPAGPAGASGEGISELSISLTSLRLVGTKVKVNAPTAGSFSATLSAGGRTIAKGTGTAKKAGEVSFSIEKTAYGTAKLKQKSLAGTLTVTFSPSGNTGLSSIKAVKAKVARKR